MMANFPYNYKQYSLEILTLIIIFSSGLFFYSLPQIIYYGYSLILITFLLLKSKEIQFNRRIIFILIIGIISICINDIPVQFAAWQRLTIFVVMILPVSSLIYSHKITIFRCKLFKLFLNTISSIIIISFIGYILQLNAFYHAKTHTFRGLMIYCMVLGPFAGVATLHLTTKAIQTKNKIFYLLSFVSFLVCLLSGSRGALIALICGFIYLTAIQCKNNITRLFKIIILLCVTLFALYPFLKPYFNDIEMKQQNNLEAGGTFASRSNLFVDRVNEFTNSPLFGSGFASVDKSIAKHTPVSIDGKTEPGSSWLFILSSLGIFAFIAFIWLIIIPIYNIYKSSNPQSYDTMLIGSLMVLFSVHMIIEGYILSAGSFLFWGAWLTIGMIQKDALNVIINEKYSIL